MNHRELLEQALEARKRAYAPYSGFLVGAALLGTSGKIYLGCNVEIASYGATCCAERVALFSAVCAGERTFQAIGIVGGKTDEEARNSSCAPCGVCRQALWEFCGGDFWVVTNPSNPESHTLEELLPCAFQKETLDSSN